MGKSVGDLDWGHEITGMIYEEDDLEIKRKKLAFTKVFSARIGLLFIF